MKHDLLGMNVTGKIFIIQPARTRGLPGKMFPEEETFNDVVKLENMVHVGTMGFDPHYGVDQYDSCGGFIITEELRKAVDVPAWFKEQVGDGEKLVLYCERCKSFARIYYDARNMYRVMLHLMIKQVFPDAGSCGYVDCAWWDNLATRKMTHDERVEVGSLGVMSVIPKGIWGICSQIGRTGGGNHLDLGYVTKKNMHTLSNFYGYDRWARFLVKKKEEQLKNFLNHEAFPSLLGPREPFRKEKK